MSWKIGYHRSLFLKIKNWDNIMLHSQFQSFLAKKFTLTVVEMQKLPDIDNIDSKKKQRKTPSEKGHYIKADETFV